MINEKTIPDVLSKHCERRGITPVAAMSAMKEYAEYIIDKILEDPSMIYYDGAESVYSYEAFDKFKQQLK